MNEDDDMAAWFHVEQCERRRQDDLTGTLKDIARTRIDDAWMERAAEIDRDLKELNDDIREAQKQRRRF